MEFAHYARSRRDFARLLGLGSVVAGGLMRAAEALPIGHTGITWGNDIEAAITDIANLGYYGFETFGNVLETWEERGGLKRVLDAHKLPLVSGYCSFNMLDPAKRKDELAKMRRWGELIRKNGGHMTVLGPNGVPRASYDFQANKRNIVER